MVITRSVLFRIREKGGKTRHTGHCSPQDISAESNLQQSTRTNNPEKTTLRRGNSGRYSLALTLEVGGAGGIRTHVRTRKPYAFYMLIPDNVFGHQQEPDYQPMPYPLKFHLHTGAYTGYFRFSCTAWPSDSEQHHWSDVSSCHLVTG